MENYNLKENETVLYRGSATVMPDGKSGVKNAKACDVWLTNLNIVLFIRTKKVFKVITEVETYSVSDVKIYDESAQVVRKKSVVDVYLKTGELFLDFEKEKEAKLFCDKALRLVSGESKFVRSVKKVRKEIKETDEALDTDIVGMVSAGMSLAANATIGIASLEGAGGKTKALGKIAEAFVNRKKQSAPAALSEGDSTRAENDK